MSIPARLLEVPTTDTGRYSPAVRAKALASLKPLPSTWRPKPRWPQFARPVTNVLLALKDWVPTEIGDTRATIRDLTRQTTMHRKHLAKLQKAKAVGEDA